MVNYQKHQPSNLTSIIRLYLPRSGGEGTQFSVIVVSSAEKEKKKTSLPNSRGLPKIGFYRISTYLTVLCISYAPLVPVYPLK